MQIYNIPKGDRAYPSKQPPQYKVQMYLCTVFDLELPIQSCLLMHPLQSQTAELFPTRQRFLAIQHKLRWVSKPQTIRKETARNSRAMRAFLDHEESQKIVVWYSLPEVFRSSVSCNWSLCNLYCPFYIVNFSPLFLLLQPRRYDLK